MVIATDADRASRLAYLYRLDREEAQAILRQRTIWLIERGVLTMAEGVEVILEGKSAIGRLICGGRAVEDVESGSGKSKRTTKQPSTALQILMTGKDRLTHVAEFLAECQDNRELRTKAEAIGIDIEDWAEQLRDAQSTQSGGTDD